LRIYPAAICTIFFTAFFIGPLFTVLPLENYLTSEQVYKYFFKNIWLWDLQMRLPGMFVDNPFPHAVNGSLWTLPYEIRMYVTVLIAGILGVFRIPAVFNLLVIMFLYLYFNNPNSLIFLENPRHIYIILPFIFGSFLYINRNRIPLSFTGVFLTIPILLVAQFSFHYDVILSAWMTYAILTIGFLPGIPVLSVDKYGDFSFGIYLYAFPVSQSLVSFFLISSPYVLMFYTVAITLLLAIIQWSIVEKPALNYKGKTKQLFVKFLKIFTP
jgi:peptidoglycan/LPS O-acetylase OafA/YrhL